MRLYKTSPSYIFDEVLEFAHKLTLHLQQQIETFKTLYYYIRKSGITCKTQI